MIKKAAPQNSPYIPRILHIEGMDIFNASNANKILSALDQRFKTERKKIKFSDESENPSERMAELTPGAWSGTILHSKIAKDGDDDGEYYAWDMKKSDFKDFISKSKKELCREIIQKFGFLILDLGDDDITDIAGRVEWISAIAFFDGIAGKLIDNLKLEIRVKYVPASDEDTLRRDRTILERAVEMWFNE